MAGRRIKKDIVNTNKRGASLFAGEHKKQVSRIILSVFRRKDKLARCSSHLPPPPPSNEDLQPERKGGGDGGKLTKVAL